MQLSLGLWWTLEQRLTEHLHQHWDQLKQDCLDEMTRMQERDSEAPWSQVLFYFFFHLQSSVLATAKMQTKQNRL